MDVLKSKRVVGAAVGLVAAVAAIYGVEIPEGEVTQAILTLGGTVLGILGGYGAARARE